MTVKAVSAVEKNQAQMALIFADAVMDRRRDNSSPYCFVGRFPLYILVA
jgi:hypothetical protein